MAFHKMSRPKDHLAPNSKEAAHARQLVRRLQNTGMNYKEIHEKTGIPKSTMANWKSGLSNPSAKTYWQLKKFFGEETPA